MLLLSLLKRLMGQFLSPQTPLRPGTLPPGPLFFGALTRASLFCASCDLFLVGWTRCIKAIQWAATTVASTLVSFERQTVCLELLEVSISRHTQRGHPSTSIDHTSDTKLS